MITLLLVAILDFVICVFTKINIWFEDLVFISWHKALEWLEMIGKHMATMP